ncbi:MAG: hypothetical protein Q7S45_02895 [Candidatus Curtissbacteria bacterium]|nr:hypothetical protein [Candidatus Curtissbacteria bacterium]
MSKHGFVGPAVVILVALISIAGLIALGIYIGKKSSGPKATNPVVTVQTSPVPSSDETENWKTYTMKDVKITFKYPPDWKMSEYPVNQSGNYSAQFNGKEGRIDLIWGGEGYGGACPGGYEKINFLSKNQDVCRSIQPNGSEIIGILSATPDNTPFDIGLTSNSKENNDLMQQILSTFKFTK